MENREVGDDMEHDQRIEKSQGQHYKKYEHLVDVANSPK